VGKGNNVYVLSYMLNVVLSCRFFELERGFEWTNVMNEPVYRLILRQEVRYCLGVTLEGGHR